MIKCPECKKDVSESAVACPSCGHPVAQTVNAPAKEKENLEKKKGCGGCLGLIGIVCIIIALCSLFAYLFLPVKSQDLGDFVYRGESPEFHKDVEQYKRMQNVKVFGVIGVIMVVVAGSLLTSKDSENKK